MNSLNRSVPLKGKKGGLGGEKIDSIVFQKMTGLGRQRFSCGV